MFKNGELENDLDIYYTIGLENSQRQENEIAAIMKNIVLQDGGFSQRIRRY